MLLYGFLEISKTVVGVAKNTIYFCLFYPVSFFSDKFEVFHEFVYVDAGVCHFLSFLRHFNENVQI